MSAGSKCPICNQVFRYQEELADHLGKVHYPPKKSSQKDDFTITW